LLGSTPEFRRDPLRAFLRSWRAYGDVVQFGFGGPFVGYLLVHPDHVRQVLQDNWRNYGKVPWYNDKLSGVLGQGLFTSEGDFWLRQRRLMQPAFHRQRIQALGTVMTDAAEESLERWDRRAEPDAPFDVFQEMMRITLTVVARALLGSDVADQVERIGRAVDVAIDHTFKRIESYFDLPGRFTLPSTRRFDAAISEFDAIVDRIIAEHRQRGERGSDLVSLLLDVQDADTGERMTDQQLRDEIKTMLLAGHETTAVALTWTWYLLSRHPEIARQLHAELAEVLGGRTPTAEDLPKLPFNRMVVEEALRLYPPAWSMSRRALDEDEIGGYRIRKGATIFLSAYVTHRHPEFWSNPEGIDPERFGPGCEAERPRFAYFPFGGGPRQCIGLQLAQTEAQLVLATIAQRYRLDLVPGHPIALDPRITLRPKHGMLMRPLHQPF
jgi:cytochrome P450